MLNEKEYVMKTIIQKLGFCILAVTAMLTSGKAVAQIDYSENFNTGASGWTEDGFEYTTAGACNGAGAIRARISNALSEKEAYATVSPSLGVSNGQEVTLWYSYSLLKYDPVIPAEPLGVTDFGQLVLEYAVSANGPWTALDKITLANYTGEQGCTERILTFTPPAETNIYLRIWANPGLEKTIDYFAYIDNLIVSQDALSVGNTGNLNPVVAYSNSSDDYLHLRYDGLITEVYMFNMQGQEINLVATDDTLDRFDISGLAKGEYILRVKADDNTQLINIIKD